jgi:CheY-like chemotaxis protein
VVGGDEMSEAILIVDDEREIADLVELYLKNEGYDVYKFYRGADALKCVAEQPLDLAILDIMLPDVDGFEICRSIREKHTYPILMLTAKEDEIDKITGLALGADDEGQVALRPLSVERVDRRPNRAIQAAVVHVADDRRCATRIWHPKWRAMRSDSSIIGVAPAWHQGPKSGLSS